MLYLISQKIILDVSGVDLIDKVQTFYQSGFNMLVAVLGVGLVIVGVVVPLLIQWYQNRSFKKKEKAFVEKLDKAVEEFQLKLGTEITTVKKLLENLEKQMLKKISDENNLALAMVFDVGSAVWNQTGYRQVVLYIHAAYYRALCADWKRSCSALDGAIKELGTYTGDKISDDTILIKLLDKLKGIYEQAKQFVLAEKVEEIRQLVLKNMEGDISTI